MKHRPALPLYTTRDAEAALELLVPTPLDATTTLRTIRDMDERGVHLLVAGERVHVVAGQVHHRMRTAGMLDFRRINAQHVIDFLADNNHFFLNVSMAACKAIADAGVKPELEVFEARSREERGS